MTEFKHDMRCMRYNYLGIALTLDCACASVIFGHLKFDTGIGNIIIYTLLYNLLSICLRPVISLFADGVTNPHTGVRLGVMLAIAGFVLPSQFGLIPKVILLSSGNAVFHAFCSSSVLSRSAFRSTDVGLYTAGMALGLGIAGFDYYYGFYAAILAMMLATPADPCEGATPSVDISCSRMKRRETVICLSLMMSVFFISGISFSSISFVALSGKKLLLASYCAVFAGRIAGGILSDKLNSLITVIISCTGGVILMALGSTSSVLSLISIFFMSLALPPLLTLTYRLMSNRAGLSASLALCFYYLGYTAANLFPFLNNKAMLPVCMALTIVIFFLTFIIVSKKETAE